MPECYTHQYIASLAMMRSGKIITSRPAFLAGVNGPDPLYFYHAWRKKKTPDLPALAERMHREKTGAFLLALVRLSMTQVEQNYALGFLAHYAADCVLYPYVEAMCQPGKPYDGAKGSNWMQTALDSELYYSDYKMRLVPLHSGTPVLITDELAQVTHLLHSAILQVYGSEISPIALADAFHDNMTVRKFFVSKTGGKKALAIFLETFLFGKKGRYAIRSRMQPTGKLKKLPGRWANPYTGEEYDLTLEEVLHIAGQTAAAYVAAAMDFWLGLIDSSQLAHVLGDNNYYTGLPNNALPV